MLKIIVASNNKGKIAEIKEIFKDYTVLSMQEANVYVDAKEDGESFAENALKKANAILEKVEDGYIVLADDSGLCIDALDGFPGVNTRRWLDGTDRERNLAIIQKMQGKENRTCRFVTSIVAVTKDVICGSTKEITGTIAEEVCGENGFGFDEIFMLPSKKTLAMLTMEEKNEISARKKALTEVLELIKENLK